MTQVTGHSCVCVMCNSPITCHREPTEPRTCRLTCHREPLHHVVLCQAKGVHSIECTMQTAVSVCLYLSLSLLCLLSLLRHSERIYTHWSVLFVLICDCSQTTRGHNIFLSILSDRDSIGTIHQPHELRTANTLNSLMFQHNDTSCILCQGHETTVARCTKTCLNTLSLYNLLSDQLTKRVYDYDYCKQK